MTQKFIGIIPARYASTRFPGKPLADLGGKTMIERVYTRVASVMDNVAVATDDERILKAVEAFGGRAVMTSAEHRSGTDRCREAARLLGNDADVVVNIQGDEPFIAPSQLKSLIDSFSDPTVQIASLARPFDPARGFEALFDPNTPKVVMDNDMNALYFSRSIIPYVRNYKWEEWLDHAKFFTHVGLYGYRRETLDKISSLPQSSLELAESLEQLRWLQAGYKIRMSLTEEPTIGIDTPADLEAARQLPPPTYPFGHMSMPVQTVETLPNGLTMHYFRGGDQPICSLSVIFPGGAAEHDEAAGRMAVNLLTEGTASHSADQLAEIIDFNGAKLGGVHMRHHTDIRLVALEHRIKDMLPVIAEIIAEPTFDTKRLQVAKIKAINELHGCFRGCFR